MRPLLSVQLAVEHDPVKIVVSDRMKNSFDLHPSMMMITAAPRGDAPAGIGD
jgi:hypothetical protein